MYDEFCSRKFNQINCVCIRIKYNNVYVRHKFVKFVPILCCGKVVDGSEETQAQS